METRRRGLMASAGEPVPPNNEVWYWADSQVTLFESTGVVTHTFSAGKGVLTFASDVTEVKWWLLRTAITNFSLPHSVVSIGNMAFDGCTNLTSVVLNDEITTIGWAAFSGCSNLSYIYLPAELLELKDYTIRATGVLELVIPAKVYSIGQQTLPPTITVLNPIPPTLTTDIGSYMQHIYVPAESVDAYKSAGRWSECASVIEAIPE